MPKWKNEETGEVVDYIPPVEMDDRSHPDFPGKMYLGSEPPVGRISFNDAALKQVFSSFPGKTLKLKVKGGETLERSVLAAYRYVSNPQQEYSRIEFKFNGCYIVVARLKEEKD